MRNTFSLAAFAVAFASPAFAASGPFFSLGNTDFVVLLGFLVFVGILVYFKIPATIAGLLDKRATDIKSELEEARTLRDEAQALLASFETKSEEVQAQAARIVENAKTDATLAAEAAKDDLKASIARRLAAAEDQIASAEASAVKQVRDQAATVAIAAAKDVIAGQMTEKSAGKLIDEAIADVGAKLH